MRLTWDSCADDGQGTFFIIFQCFSSFSTMQAHAFAVWNTQHSVSTLGPRPGRAATDKWIQFNFLMAPLFTNFFFIWSPLVRRLLFWPPSMVYISVVITHILHITNHVGPSVWAAIHTCTIPMHGHIGYYDSMWLHDSSPIRGTPWLYVATT